MDARPWPEEAGLVIRLVLVIAACCTLLVSSLRQEASIAKALKSLYILWVASMVDYYRHGPARHACGSSKHTAPACRVT